MDRLMSVELQQMMPRVLTDYLWELSEKCNFAAQSFTVKRGSLNGRPVQDILHWHDGKFEWHRVFGFDPVQANVEISYRGGQYRMSLVNTAYQDAV